MESLENTPAFDLVSKSKKEYLEQIAGNMEEKSFFLMRELHDARLPEVDGRIRILDCGIGGGELIEYLKEEHKDPYVDIVALDIVHEYVNRIKNKSQSNVLAVVGDALEPPFSPESLSAINLSSILHEIISYGSHSEQANRFSVTHELFSKLSKCLAHGGIFSYRDIYLPDNHNEKKSAVYSSHFSSFISMFGNQILQNTKKVFETDLPTILNNNDSCEISGNVHYHRELQRHFVTFADFLCTYNNGTSLKATLLSEDAPDQIDTLFKRSFLHERLLDDWGKREGFETYTYASVSEIKEILEEVSMENNLELEIEQVMYPERTEYSDFIGQYSEFVIPDKKQMMLIRKK